MLRPKLKICICHNELRPIWKRDGRDLYCKDGWLSKQSKSGENKPTKRSALPRSSKPIPKYSDKRKKQEAAYSVLRKAYLDQHPMCQMAILGVCSHQRASQIHHRFSGKDRDKYFLDTTTWLSCDHACHDWVHSHPAEARELGFLK